MLTSIWRANLYQWLLEYLPADSLELREPDSYSERLLFLSPLRNLTITQDNFQANQVITYTRKYPSTYKYHELPLNGLEGLWTTVALKMIDNYPEISPGVLSLNIEPVEGIQVRELGDGLADWYIDLIWNIEVSWLAESEPDKPDTLVQLKAVGINIYNQDILDTTLDLAPTAITDNNGNIYQNGDNYLVL